MKSREYKEVSCKNCRKIFQKRTDGIKGWSGLCRSCGHSFPFAKGISKEAKKKISERMKGNRISVGRKHTEEWKRENGERMKGKKYALGFKHTAEAKEKIGNAQKGNKHTLGRKPSPEEIKKAAQARLGYKHSEKTRRRMSKLKKGGLGSNWQGGKTDENYTIRHSLEFRLWREAIFARDNWTCQKTGARGGKLHPHHISNFAQSPELRFAIDNGVTLSEESHREFHKTYGKRNNTREQLREFLLNA